MSDDNNTTNVKLLDLPPSRLDALRARLGKAEMARDAAKAALTEDDNKEIELRRQLDAADEERREHELAKREIDVDRREEAAKEHHGPKAKITSLVVEEYPDSFVLMHEAKAFAAWEAKSVAALTNKRLKKAEIGRTYAMASVIDWNGQTDFTLSSPTGGELNNYLKQNPGIVTSIVNAVAKLAGAFQEARKS